MDTESLLRSLNEQGVEYVVIGAAAFPVHGYSRATLDIDRESARRTFDALSTFGYDVAELSIDDLLSKDVLIRQYVLETDVHPFVKGITFEQVWANKGEDRVGSTPVFFAGLDDLIVMKKTADRPRDREDLKYLESLKRRRKG